MTAAEASELADCSVAELLELYKTGQTSPLEVLEACLGRIERLDEGVNAVLTLLVDRARKQAAESTRRWRRKPA